MDLLHRLSSDRGFFLRREALPLGVDDRWLTGAVRRKRIVRIRQGAYCHTDVWHARSDVDRHVARAMASYDLTEGQVAISHVSALAMYGCPLWNVDLTRVHLTRRSCSSSRTEARVTHHRGALVDADLEVRDDRFVTRPARSAVDGLALMDAESALVAGDWLLHSGLLSSQQLWDVKDAQNHWPFTRSLEVVLRLLDGRSASVGESRTRYLFWRMGVPKPELQWEIRDSRGNLIAVTDFAWPDLGLYGEFDGRIKYGRLLKPGQDAGDAVFEEKRREDAIRRATAGTVVRWVWSELQPESAPSRQLTSLLQAAA